ncbi:N-acetylmuramoyl-L-alanine amidase [Chelativorans sp. Marseille-P2723]|uniref:N-acetylmuramoyl-L-alanine amidase n=1 Tax=Chelativorans sp. Marseille-P2723 TaxID=2709133 RepID=UPI0015709020|nr:N-acetylmuramoyl-L-alanine amidase [Chelativorans sp. Marseille-P2723]
MLLPGMAASEAEEALVAYEYRMAGDANRTRMIVYFDQEPEADWFFLRGPHRLVIDLPETKFAFEAGAAEASGMVAKVRYGRMGPEHSRMIFTMRSPFTLDDLSILQNETSRGYRLVIDIASASEEAFEAAMRERIDSIPDAGTGHPTSDSGRMTSERFTVALDAGHGGIDGGAQGANGIFEKTITLAFALELRKKLEDTGKYNVVLTRDSDVFLRLDERVRIARESSADLFISIHADAIRMRDFRGATVYTLSDQASDAQAAATAARENLSDEIAGMVIEESEDEVADILIDLIRRETHAFSIQFARTLIGKLSDTVQLVGTPLRSAGFLVLKAPDVPSVLLELGYLSNPEDEALMRDPEWRGKAADRIVEAIAAFAAAKTGG